MRDLDFTGERVVPGKVEPELQVEHESRYQIAGEHVRGRDVLDFGCGAGYGLAILKQAGARRVVGMDRSLEAVRYAGARFGGRGVEVVAGDCLTSPLADASFDLVVSFEVVEHVESYRRFLHEVRRILRHSGVFLFSTPNRKVYRQAPGTPPNPFHVHELDLAELRKAVGEVFPAMTILGQTRTEGAYFFGEDDSQLEDKDGTLKLIRGPFAGSPGRLDAAEYFFVLCGEHGVVSDSRQASGTFCVVEDDAVRRRDRRILHLQDELEERIRWVQQLKTDAEGSARRIAELQARLAEQEQQAVAQAEKRLEDLRSAKAEWEAYRNDLERRLAAAASGRAEWESSGPLVDLRMKAAEIDHALSRLFAEIVSLREELDGLRETESRARSDMRAALATSLEEQAGVVSELQSRVERIQEGEDERGALLRWHRDSLARQAAVLERHAPLVAVHEEKVHRREQLAAETRGVLEAFRDELGRQAQELAGHGERTRRAELLAVQSERLIAMLWGSRSWKVYTGVRRLFGGASRPARGEIRPAPLSHDDDAGS